jgi:succinate dehydrogenase / fumarate reductase flavoprotein subunit
VAEKLRKKQMSAADVPEDQRDYYLERKYPSFGNLAPRDISSRAAKEACDEGRGVAPTGLGVYLDFRDATQRLGEDTIRARYGNLFQMYDKIAGEDPYKGPMMIYPAVHYTMGGLWVDYNLMSNIPGLHVLGEANFSDHGANRLGASALMQGLADGYFVIPTTIANYLVTQKPGTINTSMPEFKQTEAETKERINKLVNINGKRTVDSFHRELGMIMWDKCGMARSREGLDEALAKIPQIREEFWQNVRIPGSGSNVNAELEKAGRVADQVRRSPDFEFGARLAADENLDLVLIGVFFLRQKILQNENWILGLDDVDQIGRHELVVGVNVVTSVRIGSCFKVPIQKDFRHMTMLGRIHLH